jgi:hypothetical protein
MDQPPERAFGVELLNARYDLTNFDSGDEELNDFLKNETIVEQQNRLRKTHLCFHKDRIAEFITLTADSIRIKKDQLNRSQLIEDCDYPYHKIFQSNPLMQAMPSGG